MKNLTKKQIIIIVSIFLVVLTAIIIGFILLKNEPKKDEKEELTIPTINVENEAESEGENEENSDEQVEEEKKEDESLEPQKEEIKKEKKYTVSFDTDGGNEVPSQSIIEKHKASKPADPKKDGYTFENWYLNGAVYDFAKPVTQNIKLVAKWKQNEISVTSLALDQKKYYMFTGDNVRVNTTIAPTNATNKNVEWKSSDSSIASVTNGVVLAHKAGKTTIIATVGTQTAIMEVQVLDRCGTGCFRVYNGEYYNDTKTLEIDVNNYDDFNNVDDAGYGATGNCKLDGTKYGVIDLGFITEQKNNEIKIIHEAKFKDQIHVFINELCENITE